MPRERITESLLGMKFGKWSVLSKTRKGRTVGWVCRCDCGTVRSVAHNSLKKEKSRGCGCGVRPTRNKFPKTHGLSHTRLYKIWHGMMSRCYRPETNGYEKYGGAGITVEARWHNFENFYNDMKDSYEIHRTKHDEKNTSLDRKDNSQGYSFENCKWATWDEQQRNKHNRLFIEYENEKLTITEFCEKFKMSKNTVFHRLQRGMSVKDILSIPVMKPQYMTVNGVTRSIKEWSDISGISYYTLMGRKKNNVHESDFLRIAPTKRDERGRFPKIRKVSGDCE